MARIRDQNKGRERLNVSLQNSMLFGRPHYDSDIFALNFSEKQ